jgi:acetylornithine deacetylase/succinyl-diaminopimelate desuccinylase-like protein
VAKEEKPLLLLAHIDVVEAKLKEFVSKDLYVEEIKDSG